MRIPAIPRILTGCVAAAAGVMLVAVLAAPWLVPDVSPTSDMAVIEIDVIHATRGLWDQGAYSRFGWRHPGPMHAYVLAPFYQLSGGRHVALFASAWILNMACLAFVAWAAARHLPAGTAVAVSAAVAALSVRADGLAVSIWNPHAVVLPMAATLMAAAVAAAGRPRWLASAVVGASFLAQTHVGLVPAAAAIVSAAGAAVGVAAWRARVTAPATARRGTRALLIAAAVGLVLWLPPLVEQVRAQPGNLTKIAAFFQSPDRTGQPMPLAARYAGHAFASVFRPDLTLPDGQPLRIARARTWLYWTGLQLLAVGVVAAVAWRRGQRQLAWLGSTVVLAAAVGLVAASRLDTPVADHVLYWLAAVGAVAAGLWIGGLADLVIARTPIRMPSIPGAPVWAAALVVAAAAFASIDLYATRFRSAAAVDAARTVADIAPKVGAFIDAHPGPTLIRLSESNWGEAAGVILDLYKTRRTVAVEPDWLVMFGEPLAPTGRETRELILGDEAARNAALSRPGATLIANSERLSAVVVALAPELSPTR